MTSGARSPVGTGAPADGDLAGITRLAAQVCGAATAEVHLVDPGGPGPAPGAPPSLGEIVAGWPEPGVLPDARADGRVAAHPRVTGGQVRFLAGHPIRDRDGTPLGALYVTDPQVRTLDVGQRAALAELADQVVEVLELRRRESHLLDAVGSLLRTNDELSAFAGRVAHDLRSPLTAVLGFLALVDGPFRDETSDRVRECVGSALGAAGRMRHLIDDLLAYATFEPRPVPGPIALRPLVRDVLDDLDGDIRRTGAEVTYRGAEEMVGDLTLIRQLLQNLIGNAVQHARPDRTPQVRVGVTAVDGPGGPSWLLVVADNGPGVPAEQRERIFDPLVRLAGSRRGGSGIGLATCARIADALAGTISVDEADGGGAAFRVTLPGRG